jgi:uncharacterized MAPEG superfamily protein
MTIPLWCLLVAVLLPYVWFGAVAAAKKEQFGNVDNKVPRAQSTKLEGKGARALAAHQNAFEALMVFTPAVLVSHVRHADPTQAAALAGAWVVFRVLHGILYLADIDKARSAMFALGMLSAVGLFVISALAP